MTNLGNRLANAIWEARLTVRNKKPEPNSSQVNKLLSIQFVYECRSIAFTNLSQEEKERYIVAKYSRKEFLSPLPSGMTASAALLEGICRSDVKSVPLALAHADSEDVNAPISPRDARTPLHVAASLGSLPIVQLLIWVRLFMKPFIT